MLPFEVESKWLKMEEMEYFFISQTILSLSKIIHYNDPKRSFRLRKTF